MNFSMKTNVFLKKNIGIMICLLLSVLWMESGFSADQKVMVVEPGNCSRCHQEKSILIVDHVSTKSMRMGECLECHKEEGMQLEGKMSGSHLHLLRGMVCRDCHGDKETYSLVGTDTCLKCHISGQAVAKLTDTLDPNPHNSIHYGEDLDCDLCHHMHKKSELYCDQCHMFSNVVP